MAISKPAVPIGVMCWQADMSMFEAYRDLFDRIQYRLQLEAASPGFKSWKMAEGIKEDNHGAFLGQYYLQAEEVLTPEQIATIRRDLVISFEQWEDCKEWYGNFVRHHTYHEEIHGEE